MEFIEEIHRILDGEDYDFSFGSEKLEVEVYDRHGRMDTVVNLRYMGEETETVFEMHDVYDVTDMEPFALIALFDLEEEISGDAPREELYY